MVWSLYAEHLSALVLHSINIAGNIYQSNLKHLCILQTRFKNHDKLWISLLMVKLPIASCKYMPAL